MGIIIKQSLKSTIINYIGAFIGFLSTMFVIVKFLTPEDVGLTRIILDVGLLFSTLAMLGTSSSAMRFFPYFKDKEKKNNGFFFYLVAIPLIGCLIFIPIYLLLKEPIYNFFGKESPLFLSYYYWVIPLIVFLVYWAVFETYSNVNMRIVFPKFVREVLIRVLLVAAYLMYGLHIINRDGLVTSFVAVYGIAMVAVFIYVSRIAPISLKHDNSFVDKPLRKDIGKYTGYLMIGALSSTILGKLDVFMISSEMGLSFTGIYSIAFFMGAIIDIPARSIMAISSPIAAAALKNGDTHEANELYKKVSLHQLMTSGLIFVLIWINIDNIYAIIPKGEIYSQGKWVFFFIAIARLIEVTLNFGGQLISFSKYYKWSMYFVFIIMGLGIATNLLLIPRLGMNGAAIATLISCLLSYSFQQFIVLKKLKANPYTVGTLKVLAIIFILFLVNYFVPSFTNPYFDAVVRTAVISMLAICAIYFWKVSLHVNAIIYSMIRKFRK